MTLDLAVAHVEIASARLSLSMRIVSMTFEEKLAFVGGTMGLFTGFREEGQGDKEGEEGTAQ